MMTDLARNAHRSVMEVTDSFIILLKSCSMKWNYGRCMWVSFPGTVFMDKNPRLHMYTLGEKILLMLC